MQAAGTLVGGAVWAASGYGAVQLVRLGANLLLARWLAPESFGVLAIANSVQIGLLMMSDVGIGPSIIRHERGRQPRFLDVVWTLQIIRGLLLSALAVAIAMPLGRLYGVPELQGLLVLIALGGLAGSFASTAIHTLPRDQRLARLNLFEISIQLVAYGAMLFIAWETRSVWSLAVGGLIHGCLRAGLSHWVLPGHRHRLAWDPAVLGELLRFGRWIVLSTLITFLAGQSDRLALGLLAPLSALGVYAIASGLALLPREVAGRLADSVILPFLSRSVRDDPRSLSAGLARVRGLFLPAGLLLSAALATGSPLFFRLLYDERYHAAVDLAPILVLLGWIGATQVPLQRALLALGHSRPLATSNLARWGVGLAASLVAYGPLGLTGFALGLCLGAAAGAAVLHRAARSLGLDFGVADTAYVATLSAFVLATMLCRSAGMTAWSPIPGESLALAVSMVLLGVTAIWTASRVVQASR
jgi:O-antigen/teichoic acid export membrane protein